MGLIKDALGSALGAGQVSNGFNGPSMPFQKSRPISQQRYRSDRDPRTGQYSPRPYQDMGYIDAPPDYDTLYDDDAYRSSQYQSRRYAGQTKEKYAVDCPSDDHRPRAPSPISDRYAYSPMDQSPTSQYSQSRSSSPRSSCFRPFAIPQIDYGEGQPFLRAYSHELSRYGINERDFVQIVDAINVAIVPNPENQIFQKAAGIAGWFIPGAGGIALMGGQVVAGLGTAVGHASRVNRTLSKANLELFVPNGLEICIGKTTNLDQEVGVSSVNQRYATLRSPGQRLAGYGSSLAPITSQLPPLQNVGRSDPLAAVGRGLSSRTNQKKMSKAQEDMAKGKTKKLDSLEQDFKWLIVRRASPGALSHWRQQFEQSNAAIEQEQMQQSQSSQARY